ncbi:MAG: hypothetical protein M1821_006699 [Bathelium mastoideum]|nr:MAG: hypothetical protein M1821_006699 [Bathelium mastoideum]
MSSHPTGTEGTNAEELDEAMLDPGEAAEEIADDADAHMDSDNDEDQEGDPEGPIEEIQLQNDSVAHFDSHKDSIFCIAQHPVHPEVIATGGGDDLAYIFDGTPPDRPVLPASYQTDPQPTERESLKPIIQLDGHSDSVNAIAFTAPQGQYLLTAGLDGRLRAWQGDSTGKKWQFLTEAQEVEEINWLASCPNPSYPNTIALGASDGSVWVYTINAEDVDSPLTIVQAFYLHTAPCTAGAWTPDGKLLGTVSEDASFYVWDVFGEAAAAGLAPAQGAQSIVGLTADDERFKVEGGLYSVAISPNGTLAAVGGAEGHIRIVGLPRLGADPSATAGSKGAGAKSKSGGGKQAGGPKNATAGSASAGQAGQILASLKAQSDSVETLSFSQPPLTLLASGSVDGSIALFDTAHRFAVRRHIRDAHEEEAVIKVDFVKGGKSGMEWLLTSAGNDGVVRRWDTRGGTAAPGQGLAKEWRGHRGEGEGGGVLGFVQGGGGEVVVTAGDE